MSVFFDSTTSPATASPSSSQSILSRNPPCSSSSDGNSSSGGSSSSNELLTMRNDKIRLDALLNSAMSALYAKCGQSTDPAMQSAIHSKLSNLRSVVGVIEQDAKRKHLLVDAQLNATKKALQKVALREHETLRRRREQRLTSIYGQFRQWVDAVDIGHNQTEAPQPPQLPIARAQSSPNNNSNSNAVESAINSANGTSNANIVIIADNSGQHILNAFVVQANGQRLALLNQLQHDGALQVLQQQMQQQMQQPQFQQMQAQTS